MVNHPLLGVGGCDDIVGSLKLALMCTRKGTEYIVACRNTSVFVQIPLLTLDTVQKDLKHSDDGANEHGASCLRTYASPLLYVSSKYHDSHTMSANNDIARLCSSCRDIDLLAVYRGEECTGSVSACALRDSAPKCDLCHLLRLAYNQNTLKEPGNEAEEDYYTRYLTADPFIFRRVTVGLLDDVYMDQEYMAGLAKFERETPLEPLREIEVSVPTNMGIDVVRLALYAPLGMFLESLEICRW